MTRTAASIAYAAAVSAATVAVALVSAGAYAESPTIDTTPFVGTKTRAEVQAELKTPYIGGNPWSTRYDMFAQRGALTKEQVRGAYKMSREEVHALTAEDSGSAFLAAHQPAMVKTTTLGGPGAALSEGGQ